MGEFDKIRLKCVGCERFLRVPISAAGKQVRCPDDTCAAISQIPGSMALEALIERHEVPSAPPVPSDMPTADAASLA